MKQISSITLLLVLSATSVVVALACNCLLYNNDFRCRLSTKTPYRCVANYDDSPLEFSGCAAKKIWLILRHGTRYPGKKYVPLMLERLPQLREIILDNYERNQTELTAEDADLFFNWKITLTDDDIMKLTEEGEDEMIDLGERYQNRFPSLMPEFYNNETYKFKYTAAQRTQESAKHFTTGLFGKYSSNQVWYPKAEHKDPILRFYKRCTRWRLEVDKNPSSHLEQNKFSKTEIYTKTLGNISNRIGFEVDPETARLMYITCGFETSWYKNVESPWCKIFSLHDFKVLEFSEDLDYYWVDGYGHKLTYEQACPALRDMFQFFTSDGGPLVSAYFTHSGTILKLLALLGVAKDDQHLTHDLFSLYGNDRGWRTSAIDAFGSNIAFVLYNCSSGSSVLFMHQERPLYLPGCPLHKPCPLSTMKALYPDHEQECEFAKMCSVEMKTP